MTFRHPREPVATGSQRPRGWRNDTSSGAVVAAPIAAALLLAGCGNNGEIQLDGPLDVVSEGAGSVCAAIQDDSRVATIAWDVFANTSSKDSVEVVEVRLINARGSDSSPEDSVPAITTDWGLVEYGHEAIVVGTGQPELTGEESERELLPNTEKVLVVGVEVPEGVEITQPMRSQLDYVVGEVLFQVEGSNFLYASISDCPSDLQDE